MSTTKIHSHGIALAAILLGASLTSGAATAGPLAAATNIASIDGAQSSNVQTIRHRGWGGVGIYIGPSYGYYPRYGYYDDGYDYYPRRRAYRSYGYDRRYRKHSRRWVKERFEHPLGRR